MNTSSPLWKKRLVLGALAAILPLSAVADGRHSASSMHGRCDGPPPVGNVAMYPHHEMGRPGMMPQLPFLHRIELSEAQQDKVFELMTANLPAERAKAKLARKSMDDLRKLGAADAFDPVKARELAAAHSQAMADLLVMRAETEAKVRALLTTEQRGKLNAAEGEGGGHCTPSRRS
ncbi:MAG: Spy/CpxP family protein refolding chaperone [Zoogloea sp.]|nr:Spy/CpxP family protein refolding chaperone [Zoogloea sp.]